MSERKGWVKLLRTTVDNPLLNKDPDHLALWIHLLCGAAFEPTPALLGGKRIVLQPGQLTTGRKQLAVNSRIQESKVERTLKAFENNHLIEQQKTNKNRLITILPWNEIQCGEQQIEQPVNNERTTSEQPLNTLEEIKNTRNEEYTAHKAPRSRFVPPSVEEVQTYCAEKGYSIDPQLFVAHYETNGWVQSSGRPIKNWKAAVVSWVRRDKASGKERKVDNVKEKIVF